MTPRVEQELLWSDVALLAASFPGEYRSARIFGIPRGGAHVAQAIKAVYPGVHLADAPSEADVIVDDLIDSGRTAERWSQCYGVPVWALVDKRPDPTAPWYVFPWEAFGGDAPAEDNALRMLQSLGVPLDEEGTRETPARMMRSLRELTSGYGLDPAELLSKRFPASYDEMVVVRGIGFWSLCEHHVLPFHGTATVGYLPGEGGVVGLSKVARLVHAYSRRLQIQERMTQQIAQAMSEHLGALGVGVVVRASHLCMAMRGVRTPAEMVTSALLGRFRVPEVRAEFLALADGARP